MTRIAAQTDTECDDHDFEIVVTYDLEGECCPAEPYSWGGSRGTECSINAEIVNVRLGAFDLSRSQAALIWGEETLQDWERIASERAMERFHAGELEAA